MGCGRAFEAYAGGPEGRLTLDIYATSLEPQVEKGAWFGEVAGLFSCRNK